MAEKAAEKPKEEKVQGKKEPEATAEKTEEEPEETETAKTGNIGNLLSPEAVIMLPLAIFFDLIGIIIVCFGLDDFGITDIFAIVIFGPWMFLKSGNAPDMQKLKKGKKPPQGPGKKLFNTAIKEIIPYLGAFPWWTITVIGVLREG